MLINCGSRKFGHLDRDNYINIKGGILCTPTKDLSLHKACDNLDLNNIVRIANSKKDIIKDLWRIKDQDGYAPIHRLVLNKKIKDDFFKLEDMLNFFSNQSLDFNILTNEGKNILHLLLQQRPLNIELIRVIIR